MPGCAHCYFYELDGTRSDCIFCGSSPPCDGHAYRMNGQTGSLSTCLGCGKDPYDEESVMQAWDKLRQSRGLGRLN